MKKYWLIAKNEIQRQFTYRVNILAYAGGNFLELFTQIIIWTAIFKKLDFVKGYNYNEMVTYVIVGWIFMYVTTNYGFETLIAKDINLGRLSIFLVKPVSYLRFMAAESVGRVIIALMVVIMQSIIWLAIFKNHIVFNLNFKIIVVFFIMLILAYLMKFFFSVIIGLIGFWTDDVSGAFYSLNILIKIFSGAFFPLSLLPAEFINLSLKLPFSYIFFVPAQLFIGKISLEQGLKGLLIMSAWIVILYFIIKLIWKLGLKKYESAGI